ncbi:hypothetical protein OSH11_00970 [Kaistia dalseonensis]|uniref:Uncharacterized protein n=1 Tax=Kaistia dalseonensis TaxID=410840 RepID=A0ABU0H2U6_9HYPH|nr:hypothetical protein [Kaistia dalseonensis]MCX5493267.1 hypothetical protein [Kaistia dalseonensis]MDQ0435824.1 hypothetical protein [Kaistia dalseonensis]
MLNRRDIWGLLALGTAAPVASALAEPAASDGGNTTSWLDNIVEFGSFGRANTEVRSGTHATLPADHILFIPPGIFHFDKPVDELRSRLLGLGQIKTTTGKTAPFYSQVSDRPQTGDQTTIYTAFDGDVSHIQFATEHIISGKDTLGTPSWKSFGDMEWDRLYTPEAYPHFTYLLNKSGYNDYPDYGLGRTVAAAHHVKLDQFGQGDAAAYSAYINVSGRMPGSTDFLANASGHIIHGQVHARADGVFLEPYEVLGFDEGHDVGYVGHVTRGVRTNDTGANHAVWMGYVAKSVDGTKPWNVFYTAYGHSRVGIDLTQAYFEYPGFEGAALVLKRGDGVYFDGSVDETIHPMHRWHAASIGRSRVVYAADARALQVVGDGTIGLSVGVEGVGFFGASPQPKPSISGKIEYGATLKKLLAALDALGLISDDTGNE